MKAILKPSDPTLPIQNCELFPADSGDGSALSYEHIPEHPMAVFSDALYHVIILFDETVPKNIYLSVNEDRVMNLEKDGEKKLVTVEAQKIFDNSYGYVQLEVEYPSPLPDEENILFRSDYLEVMVRDCRQEQSIPSMFRFVRMNYKKYLFSDRNQSESHLNREILLLEDIQRLYKQNLNYFRVVPYQVIDRSFTLDDFSKLSRIPYETIQYMIQHPEMLRPTRSSYGVEYEGTHYLPDKALIQNTRQNPDCYENEIVLSFLSVILTGISDLLRRFNAGDSLYGKTFGKYQFYHSSAGEVLSLLQDQRTAIRRKLEELRESFEKMLWLYRSILPVQELRIIGQPQPSHVFLEREPYRQFYEMMAKWFHREEEETFQEQLILPLVEKSGLYEYYILLKLMATLEKKGYELDREKSCRFEYDCPDKRFRNVDHLNTFVFRPADASLPEVTLYYEPVIYGKMIPEHMANGISLRRTTTLSYLRNEFPGYMGAFYTPDYVLKAQSGAEERYLIADAKFRRFSPENIVEYQFKYHFSIQPIAPTAQIKGVMLFYGKTFDMDHGIRNIFDLYQNPNTPFLHFTTLTESEELSEGAQQRILNEVIDSLIF